MLMHASCGAPLHGLGVCEVGAFTGFPATTAFGVDVGVSIATTLVFGGVGAVTTATGASAGGSDAQPTAINAPSIASTH
jgi:hypothetical protein